MSLNEYLIMGNARAESQLQALIHARGCDTVFPSLGKWDDEYPVMRQVLRKHDDFHRTLELLHTLIEENKRDTLVFRETAALSQLLTHELKMYILGVLSEMGSRLQTETHRLFTVIFVGLFIVFLSLVFFLYWFNQTVLSRLLPLDALAANMAFGDYSRDVPVSGNDEITTLARSFNTMRSAVQASLQEISAEKDKIDIILSSIGDAVVAFDLAGHPILLNGAAERLCALTHEEALQCDQRTLFTLRSLAGDVLHPVDMVLRTGEPIDSKDAMELVRSDGSALMIAHSASPLRTDTKEIAGVVLVLRDVSEEFRLREMMIQNEKMLSVGGLAAGMAHEINNPLAGIMQTAEVLETRLLGTVSGNRQAAERCGITLDALRLYIEDRKIDEMLRIIHDSGKRVSQIVDNMLGFARKSDARSSTHQVTDLIDQALELARTDYDLKKQYDFKSIKIEKDYEADLPPVFCDAGKLQQVFLNIFSNGAHAMQNAEIKKPPCFSIRVWFDPEKSDICLEIADNGPGMSESVRKRVFEPFFTTKPVGVGTGLGLSVSYFIITRDHRGSMDVRSAPGEGATFIITLPVQR